MPKRSNPFGDCSPLQLKTHVGIKEINYGASTVENMQTVYDKTKQLLFKSSKRISQATDQSIYNIMPMDIDDDIDRVDSLPPHLLAGQLHLDISGRLVAPRSLEGLSRENSFESDLNKKQVFTDLLPESEVFGSDTVRPCQMTSEQSKSTNKAHGGTSLNYSLSNWLLVSTESVPGHSTTNKVCESLSRNQDRDSSLHSCAHAAKSVACRKCTFCQEMACPECMHICCHCRHCFCHLCCTVNYDERLERIFCLQCHQDVASH